MAEKILVIDDEEEICKTLKEVLEDEGYEVKTVINGVQAIEIIRKERFDLIIIDIWMPGIDGFSTLKNISLIDSDLEIIVISGYVKEEEAFLKAINLKAFDFIEKPFSINKIVRVIKHALTIKKLKRKNKELEKKIENKYLFVEKSNTLINLIEKIKLPNVLIIGEKGTEKEDLAFYLHKKKYMDTEALFSEINCYESIDLLEEQIFGYEKGSFSTALSKNIGILEQVERGSIFFKNIDKLSISLQTRLLEILEKREFRRIGGKENIRFKADMIFSSEKDLKKEIFKEKDLYLLDTIVIPPLRERKEEIKELAFYFLDFFCKQYGEKKKKFSSLALNKLENHFWSYNIKELRNTMEKLVISKSEEEIIQEEMIERIINGTKN